MTSSNSPDESESKPGQLSRRYGGMSAEERSLQRRQKLLEASLEVFGTLGLRKATMRDICNEARIAERYFSEHFASAAEAYEAVFKQISEQALVTTGVAMTSCPFNTHDMAIAGLTAFFQFVKEDPRRAQIMLIDASSYWRHVTIRTNKELNRHANAMKHFSSMLYPDLPKKIELEIVGGALIGLSIQSCLNWVQSGFKQPVDVVVHHLMFAWDGLDRWFKNEIAAAHAAKAEAQAKAASKAKPKAADAPAAKTVAAGKAPAAKSSVVKAKREP